MISISHKFNIVICRNQEQLDNVTVSFHDIHDKFGIKIKSYFFQNELVSWLSEEMSSHEQLDVDYLDKAGKSPLHLAARRGNVSTVSTLLNHGAQIGLKNDMGLKAFDYARLMEKNDCAEFLLLYEASLSLSRDLLDAKCQKDQVQTELNELTVQFK